LLDLFLDWHVNLPIPQGLYLVPPVKGAIFLGRMGIYRNFAFGLAGSLLPIPLVFAAIPLKGGNFLTRKKLLFFG